MPAVGEAALPVSGATVVADAGRDVAAKSLEPDPEPQARGTEARPEPSCQSAGAPRRRLRAVAPREPSRERSQPGRWGGVAVLAVVAAVVWAAVLAVEYRGPASPQPGDPVVRLAAEPEATGGRSVR